MKKVLPDPKEIIQLLYIRTYKNYEAFTQLALLALRVTPKCYAFSGNFSCVKKANLIPLFSSMRMKFVGLANNLL